MSPAASQQPIACCCKLRSKSMYYRPNERPGRIHESETLVYWCFHTQSPTGPDEQLVSPSQCGPGRSCYRDESGS